jgi:hypothetical protein
MRRQSFSQPVGVDSSAEVAGSSSRHSMTRSVLESWLRLRAIEGVGDLTVLRLVCAWHSPEAVLRASRDELIQNGCSSQLADAIRRGPDSPACRSIERELKAIERERVEVRSLLDPAYPARLKMITDPPPLLYVTGTLTDQDALAVAIVGARRATAAGRTMTEELSRDLAGAGMTVVSGLARGVDAAAHRGALAAQGRTIAVLGCGIDRTYPPEHERLRRQMIGCYYNDLRTSTVTSRSYHRSNRSTKGVPHVPPHVPLQTQLRLVGRGALNGGARLRCWSSVASGSRACL